MTNYLLKSQKLLCSCRGGSWHCACMYSAVHSCIVYSAVCTCMYSTVCTGVGERFHKLSPLTIQDLVNLFFLSFLWPFWKKIWEQLKQTPVIVSGVVGPVRKGTWSLLNSILCLWSRAVTLKHCSSWTINDWLVSKAPLTHEDAYTTLPPSYPPHSPTHPRGIRSEHPQHYSTPTPPTLTSGSSLASPGWGKLGEECLVVSTACSVGCTSSGCAHSKHMVTSHGSFHKQTPVGHHLPTTSRGAFCSLLVSSRWYSL